MDKPFNELSRAGPDSSYLMRGTLETLADMQKLPDEDFPFRKQVSFSFSDLIVKDTVDLM